MRRGLAGYHGNPSEKSSRKSVFARRLSITLVLIYWSRRLQRWLIVWRLATHFSKRSSKKVKFSMNELLSEWIEKAEGDYKTAQRELRARKRVKYD
jgi:hypothetical protein